MLAISAAMVRVSLNIKSKDGLDICILDIWT